MFHQKISAGAEVEVALPKDLPPEIFDLYRHHRFLDGIHILESIADQDILSYSISRGFSEVSFFLKTAFHWRGIGFYKLSEWFHNPCEPQIEPGGIGIHWGSSAHWSRPAIPHWRIYLDLIRSSGRRPVFLGGASDEEQMISKYPGIRDYCSGEEDWRFGRDPILQTMANIGELDGMISFSSWTAYAAVLQGVPALELWDRTQWLVYTSVTRVMLGNPAHYLQDAYDSPPCPGLLSVCFEQGRKLASLLYDFPFRP